MDTNSTFILTGVEYWQEADEISVVHATIHNQKSDAFRAMCKRIFPEKTDEEQEEIFNQVFSNEEAHFHDEGWYITTNDALYEDGLAIKLFTITEPFDCPDE